MSTALRSSFLLAVAAILSACESNGSPQTDAGQDARVSIDAAPTLDAAQPTPDAQLSPDAFEGDAGPLTIPLDPASPWPKFRANPWQDGRVDIDPIDNGAMPWEFPTGKGIFSTPVIDGDGNVYVGSADRLFYSIAPDGTERWSVRTGEIIDSSALLDDLGRVYFGSGDGYLRALDRDDGDEIWRFQADDPSVNGAFIRWFEGNVALLADGTLVAPNDNFHTYGVDRQTGARRWAFRTSDQTWSLPAVDVTTNRLYIGNNFYFLQNVIAFDGQNARQLWFRSVDGSVAASPMLVGSGPDATIVVGGFDGFVHAYRAGDGMPRWQTGVRDHIYASPARLSDGTIIQPAADGTVYAMDPDDGSIIWSFDALEPLRSSPAIDGNDQIYLGSGEGRLFVLNPDGSLRWAMRLIDANRDDLNASVALGERGIFVAGENGGVFYVPFDYCMRPGLSDDRCRLGPGEDLPDDGALMLFTTRFGRPMPVAPPAIDANQPIVLSLFVRETASTLLSAIDGATLQVDVTPPVDVRVDLSGDRRFVLITPNEPFMPDGNGRVQIRVRATYLVDLSRVGLRFEGGTPGGMIDQVLDFEVRPAPGAALALPIASAPGDDTGIIELYRIAAPLPTILPSYNQIGFDSIHYLIGLVEGDSSRAIAWGIGAAPSGPNGETEIDPNARLRFPLVLRYQDGLATLSNDERFIVEFNGFDLPFDALRVSARTDAMLNAMESPSLTARTTCADIQFYGTFLQRLGFCNPVSDTLLAAGAAELRAHGTGTQSAPAGIGTVTVRRDQATDAGPATVTASFTGTSLRAGDHNYGILLIDETSGLPINYDYVNGTSRTAAGELIDTVTLVAPALTTSARVYVMVDAYPAFRATLPAD